MFLCGDVSEQAQKLCEATQEAMEAGIAVCKPGAPIKEIGKACNAVAERHKCGLDSH